MRTLILLIDGDDTLLDFKAAERQAVSCVLKEEGVCDVENVARLFSEINAECWRQVERGEKTREQIGVDRFVTLFSQCGISGDPVRACQSYKTAMRSQFSLIHGAKEFLTALKNRGHRLFLITNGLAATQKSRLEGSRINGYFEDIFISEDVGVSKPDKAYFEYVKSHIPQFDDSRCYIIGDSLTADVKGGNNSNIPVIWYNAEHKPLKEGIYPDYQACSYGEILSILDSL